MAILAAVGDVAYDWQIGSDRLVWGGNAGDVLKVEHPAAIASGRDFAQLVQSEAAPTRHDAVMKSTQKDDGSGVPYQIQYCFRPSADSHLRFWLEDTGRWFAGPDGAPVRAQGTVRVINDRREREQRLAFLAQCDGLTGELNRWHLIEALLRTLEDAIQVRSSCGFLLVAIDNLAHLNDGYGFGIGDEVISAVAKRIRGRMRGGDFLGRYSGNKFGIVLKKCTPDEMTVAAERMLAGVRDELVTTSLGPVAVTVTIGGVTAPRHARTVEEVLARAHEAMASAKAKRHGSFLAYKPNLERDALRRESMRSTDEIVAALNERRISLAHEPVVSAATRKPAFYECLMRVQRPDGSMVPTKDVVPVAERLGLVRLLDHRVLGMVVEELVAAPTLNVSVNVSPASTMDPEWWAGLGALLRRHRGVAERLTIEITETTAIHDIDDTRAFVARVKELGCRIAIDDFGAGHTSFRNLRNLGVDIVKIDGAFVQNLSTSADDRAFVQTLIDLAHRLGLKTVAEWVQDEESAKLLAEWGCDYLQGALIGLASPHRPWRPDESSKAAASA